MEISSPSLQDACIFFISLVGIKFGLVHEVVLGHAVLSARYVLRWCLLYIPVQHLAVCCQRLPPTQTQKWHRETEIEMNGRDDHRLRIDLSLVRVQFLKCK